MDKKVTVLTIHGRRQNIKITPNTTLLQILEEACQKHGFDSDEYGLKHHNKEMDLTQMFRFSGLPNNCLLEMFQLSRKRVAANVDICIQLEDGSRKQGQFLPSVDLWTVIQALCEEEARNYANPVAIYMRRELIGKEVINSTTLKLLGITEGRALIRFINKTAEELKTQANVYKPAEPKPVVKESISKTGPDSRSGGGESGFAITKSLVESLKKDSTTKANEKREDNVEDSANTELQTEKPEPVKYDWGSGSGHTMIDTKIDTELNRNENDDEEPEPEINIIGERYAIIYSLDKVQKHMEDIPDSFFDLTVHDLKLILRDLKKISSGNENVPMLTEKLRQLEEDKIMLNKIAKFKKCIIRIQFPDRHVLQGIFKPVENISDVVDFVRKFLVDPNIAFHLFVIPPKTILSLNKTLLEMDFVPNALVHFGLDNEDTKSTQAYIKTEFLQKLTTLEGALYAATKFRETSNRSSPDPISGTNETTAIYESKPPGPSTGAIPKRRRD